MSKLTSALRALPLPCGELRHDLGIFVDVNPQLQLLRDDTSWLRTIANRQSEFVRFLNDAEQVIEIDAFRITRLLRGNDSSIVVIEHLEDVALWQNLNRLGLPIIELRNGLIQRATQSGLMLLQERSQDRLTQRSIREFITARDLDLFEKELVAQKGKPFPLTLELGLVRTSCSATIAASSGKTQLLCVVPNMQRLDRTTTQAAHLETFSLLISGFAHEINNPLAFAMPAMEELEGHFTQEHRLSEKQGLEATRQAQEGLRRILGVVEDLRSFRDTESELEPVNVNELVIETLRLASGETPSRVRFSRGLGKVKRARGNRGRLGQVLLNLLLNAIVAGGDRIRVRTAHSAGRIIIEVWDNGRGISDEEIGQIFDPFFSRNKGGHGLGLAVSKQLLENMGANISVRSRLGEHTSFCIDLTPWDGEVPREPAPEAGEAPVQVLGQPRIRVLLVDDEPLVRSALCRSLQRGPFTVTEAASGNQAIMLLDSEVQFDVVLSDYVMDDGTGADVLRWLRKNMHPLAKHFAYISGMQRPDAVDDSGQVKVLTKPVDLAQLQITLAELARPSDDSAV